MERTIGLLGGGQLGQMLCEAANPLGIKIIVLDAENSPAKQVNARSSHVDGSFIDANKIRELARQCDILTVEIEHVDTYVLEEIAERGVKVVNNGRPAMRRVEVQPSWKTLRVIQDKFLQKQHLLKNGVAVAHSVIAEATVQGLQNAGSQLGVPYMLKARKDAYDGRGNFPVMSPKEIEEALTLLKGRELYAEKWASFKKELAVMVVKTVDEINEEHSTCVYPTVETVHEDSICKLVYAPARGVSEEIQRKAQDLARKAVSCLWGRGVFAVELFLLEDDTLLVNEIAPRPHNSGHYTIEACPTLSQYKSQLLSVLGLMPYMETIPMHISAAIVLNILGGINTESHKGLLEEVISISNAALHMYGKEPKPGRKIGHVTFIGHSIEYLEEQISDLITMTNVIRTQRKSASPSTSPTAAVTRNSPLYTQPLVAVTMGSDSDLPVLKPGLALLTALSIPYLVTITSAHRTPNQMTHFAQTAASGGIRVIIAAAGGAAHLPGMIAASTTLPVIGVPVRGSTLDGMDSLLSIVQMPRGVPVATVAINNSINAALLAARILGSTDRRIQKELEVYTKKMEEEVVAKVEKLGVLGWEAYGEKQ